MCQGDLYIPDLSGKKLKSANNVDEFFIGAAPDGNTAKLFASFNRSQLPSGPYRLYLINPYTLEDPFTIELFDLMSYLKNGGVLSRLLNHLYQCFNSLSRKWVRAC